MAFTEQALHSTQEYLALSKQKQLWLNEVYDNLLRVDEPGAELSTDRKAEKVFGAGSVAPSDGTNRIQFCFQTPGESLKRVILTPTSNKYDVEIQALMEKEWVGIEK